MCTSYSVNRVKIQRCRSTQTKVVTRHIRPYDEYVFLYLKKGLIKMTTKELADLIFPDITKTIADYEAMYPERELKEGAKVTRYAPSPTGFMHIGNFMSATIDYVMANQMMEYSTYVMKILMEHVK